MKIKIVLITLLIAFAPSLTGFGYWVWSPEAGKFVNPESQGQDSAEEQYNYAMKFYKDKNLDEAFEQLKNIVKKFPNSKTAPEAQYRIGTIYEEKGDYLKAFRAYKKLVESYPQSDRFSEVIEREFRIGNLFLSGKKGKFAGLEILPSLPRAAEVFQHIGTQAPFSEYGGKAQFQLGVTYRKWSHYAEALKAFQEVIDQYPQSELVSQARYQLAETSYLRSATEFRNQRALDEASTEVNRFLTRYPDSNISEKAAKLRQAIDEKNAEKNYRIAAYYEKQNYVQSALIYYNDVSTRYPNTQWGEKSSRKLKTLKEPEKYFSDQEKELSERLQALDTELKKESEKTGKEGLEAERKILKERQKIVEKSKKETFKIRKDDLARRQRELKEKFKNLGKKKKLMAKNQSEDFKRAMERWHASLMSEQDSLYKEKEQLAGWQQELGVRDKSRVPDFVPFLGERSTELEKVRRMQAKNLYKLSKQKKSLLEEKEFLYKRYGEGAALLKQIEMEGMSPSEKKAGEEPQKEISKKEQEMFQEAGQEIANLQKKLDQKTASYRSHYGKAAGFSWKRIPSQVVNVSADAFTKSIDKSWEILNPFDRSGTQGEERQQRLLESRMHLKEKTASQQNIVQTLTEAFDAQLAFEERRRLLFKLESRDQVNLMELRKAIKTLEKEVRSSYEEIEDRHRRQKQLLDELEGLLKERKSQDTFFRRAGKTAGAPALAGAKLVRSFLFGLPHREVELTEAARELTEKPNTEEIKKIRQEIELEGLLIEGKSKNIVNRQRELEILKTKASLAGGYKFRSVLVRVPYLFIGEAIDSAKRIIPRKNRAEILINRLHRETQRLEEFKAELKEIEKEIDQSGAGPASGRARKTQASAAVSPREDSAAPAPDEATLKKEIEALSETLEIKRKTLESEKVISQTGLKTIESLSKRYEPLKWVPAGREKKLHKELQEIESDLVELIEKEKKLENQEYGILEKRIQKIDQVIPKVHSRMLSQDLLTERERMESRLSQLQSRRDFLIKELQRFEPVESAARA